MFFAILCTFFSKGIDEGAFFWYYFVSEASRDIAVYRSETDKLQMNNEVAASG